ncbi:MAG: aconitase family protein [Candidatus Marinimicrobia bacterium]|nr:aconitase family protein [Candidatus Neomarinimicrobiota bacterium]
MSSNSMIYQLLEGANGKIEQAILSTEHVEYFVKNLDKTNIPALIINNRLPIGDGIDMKDINSLREKGVEYYPSGRTGMPALVTAEDGLAIPGTLLATTDKNLLELSVLGTHVIYLNEKDMLSLLESGKIDIPMPKTTNIILHEKVGEWVGGTDIALYLIKYFDLSKDTLLEIQGEGLSTLTLNERFNLARTLIDLGYEKLLFQVDDVVMAFLQDRTEGEGHFYFPDMNADKNSVINIELQKIHPMIAWLEKDEIKIGPLTDKDAIETDLIFIGGNSSCRFADIQEGLKLIRYRPLADTVTACIMPGSQLVNGDLLDMGIAGILTEIGFDLLPSSFLNLLAEQPDTKRTRLGTSVKILYSGGMVANALSCFSAAMTGKITHPLELESILKHEEEYNHDHEHKHE